ncbi:MAG: hypothetical protein QNJ22_16600 [Desulfosarcinaceae bacterium]|nr:hypothetical protein [Desulfosarcinaceae bacterium]
MTEAQFMESLAAARPPQDLGDLLTALWWDRNGDWDRAHRIAQENPTELGSAVHAYLHREEGVLWNADYWYRRAGRQRPELSLEEEWALLLKELLTSETD